MHAKNGLHTFSMTAKFIKQLRVKVCNTHVTKVVNDHTQK